MQAIAISNGNTNKIYVIWEIPHDGINRYEVYRNGVLVAFSASDIEPEGVEFEHPTLFDHDHHTNLFKKDSTFKLMFTDESIKRYQTYEYLIIAKRLNESQQVMEEIKSNTMTITAS